MKLSQHLLAGAILFLTGCATMQAEVPDGFSDIKSLIPDLVTDIRYYGEDNFVGTRIDGYLAPKCILSDEAASALVKVQADLAVTGLGLKVFDCYRPAQSVAHFVRWAKDLDDTRMKAKYYPNVLKSELFVRGYIAERSGHSRASTVDLTLIDLKTGEELDMGAGYDLFDPLSWPGDQRPNLQQRANRALLRSVMLANGFKPLKEEWWHFTLKDEPYPSTYHDFPVQ